MADTQCPLRLWTLLAIMAIGAPGASAQDLANDARVVSGGLSFDVASVRESPEALFIFSVTPGRFRVAGYPLRLLLTFAYEDDVSSDRLIAPDWTRNANFNIDATMAPDTTRPQLREMVRRLLEQRFAMKVKREVRSMSVLALVRDRADGALGPGLRQVERDCEKERCAEQQTRGSRIIRGATWNQMYLAKWVGGHLNTIVFDRTGLSGQFDLSLQWQYALTVEPDEQSDAPLSLEAALREQLGLRLDRAREDVELLVVEQISMPSPN